VNPIQLIDFLKECVVPSSSDGPKYPFISRGCVTGSPWRDLPSGFGNWNSTFIRFRRWAQRGVFDRIFESLSSDADFEYVMVDGTIVSVHQKASGAKGGLRIRLSDDQKAV